MASGGRWGARQWEGVNFLFLQPFTERGFPGGSEVKASAYNAGDLGSIPGSEDFLEKEMATYSSILAWKNSMDGEAWQATVHGGRKELDMTE